MCSSPRPMKRVRFQDSVQVLEIAPIDLQPEEEEVRNDADSTSQDATATSSVRSSANSNLLYDVFSSCSSSANYGNSVGPIKRPMKIPSMLFNTLPVPVDSSSTNKDKRWKGPERNPSKAIAVPTRAPSIDEILGNALAILEAPITVLDGNREELSSQKNHSWDKCDFHLDVRKRWKEDSHSPPSIPQRKISATSLEDAMRRYSYPGSKPRAKKFPPF